MKSDGLDPFLLLSLTNVAYVIRILTSDIIAYDISYKNDLLCSLTNATPRG